MIQSVNSQNLPMMQANIPRNNISINPVQSKSSFIQIVARIFIISLIPATVFWIPLHSQAGVGNFTLLDLIFVFIWAITLSYYCLVHSHSNTTKIAFKIAMFTVLIGLLAMLASIMYKPDKQPISEILIFMKRFGSAGIIPLALSLFMSRSLRFWSVVTSYFCLASLWLCNIFPVARALLPIANTSATSPQNRAIGAISNPNDFAYISILLLLIIFANTAMSKRFAILRILICVSALFFSIANLITSGSR